MKTLGIVNLSVNKRVTILMLCMIILVFGFLSLSRLGLDMLPNITYPMLTVVTQYPGVAPEEIEQLVTVPLEGAIASVNGVKKLNSQSSEGVSAINVEFEWGTNLDYGAQDIKDNIDMIKDFLPEDMQEPIVFKFNLSQIPIMFIGITGEENTYKLRKLLEDNVIERLQRIDGVAQAAVFGGKDREIHVLLDPAKLKYRGVSIDHVLQALPMQNMNLPAGHYIEEKTDFLLRSVGEFKTITDIENAIIHITPNGIPIRLRDVGTIKDTYREVRNESRMNGKESVFLVINKRSGSNTLQVSKKINKELALIKQQFSHLSFIDIFDQGAPVANVTKSTSINAIIGAVLAIVFMLVFLMNIRPTLVIAVAIPLSIITTFIAIYLFGFTLNLMTLGGLALGVGMLVDNAIVVIENIYRHLERGIERKDAAKIGASEVAMAITASTFTTIVVFLPILFSEGLAANLTRGLSITIMFALLSSLFVALTIVPMLASVFFKERRTTETTRWFKPIRELYGKQLTWVLKHPFLSMLSLLIVLAVSIVVFVQYVGKEFMPEGDQNMFLVQIELPIGTPLKESSRIGKQVASLMQQYPEIDAVGESIGRDENDRGGDQAGVSGPHVIQFFVRLKDASQRTRSIQEIRDHIRERLPTMSNTRIRFTSMGAMGGNAKPVKVDVLGKSIPTLTEITNNIASVMKTIPALKDIETSFMKARPEYHFIIDRQKALMYGLMPYQIQTALKAANLGQVATRLRTGEDEIGIRVILEEKYRNKLEWIKTIPLKTPTGKTIPISQVVTVQKDTGPMIINRANKFRVGSVDANISEKALGTVVNELKEKLKKIEQALPEGYSIQFKGQFEDMQETFKYLLLGLAIAVLLVYMVMASQFESLMHPLIIMFTFPLAFIGVAWILFLTGKTFSVIAFVGLIILAGIAVNNGIVLIDYVNQLRHQGMAARDALVEAGKTRIRPILITAGTTIAGMIPMAFSSSDGAEMRSPMALTVIGGLFSATLLTLFIIPLMYLFFDFIGNGIKNLVKKVVR